MENIFLNTEFLAKWYFLLFLIIPIILFFFYKKEKKWINFIFFNDLKKIFWKKLYFFYWKIFLIFAILATFFTIFANPNIVNTDQKVSKNWIDIVVALDISGSMNAEDLRPNRIESAKSVISKFIETQKTNRVWLVVFAWKPFTSIPLTFDYNILTETLKNLSTDNINQNKRWLNWTAIWDAILMSKTMFKKPKDASEEDYKKREKVVILLTDWDANVWVDPVLAGLAAKKEWIKIYTIWIWSKQWWYITYNMWPFKQKQKIPPLNDKALKTIAQDTWAQYFRAENNQVFQRIFDELEKLEKNDISVKIKKEYSENYDIFLKILMWLMFLFWVLNFMRVN